MNPTLFRTLLVGAIFCLFILLIRVEFSTDWASEHKPLGFQDEVSRRYIHEFLTKHKNYSPPICSGLLDASTPLANRTRNTTGEALCDNNIDLLVFTVLSLDWREIDPANSDLRMIFHVSAPHVTNLSCSGAVYNLYLYSPLGVWSTDSLIDADQENDQLQPEEARWPNQRILSGCNGHYSALFRGVPSILRSQIDSGLVNVSYMQLNRQWRQYLLRIYPCRTAQIVIPSLQSFLRTQADSRCHEYENLTSNEMVSIDDASNWHFPLLNPIKTSQPLRPLTHNVLNTVTQQQLKLNCSERYVGGLLKETRWILQEGTKRLSTGGCFVPHFSDYDLRQILLSRNVTSLTFIGDSVLRIIFKYTRQSFIRFGIGMPNPEFVFLHGIIPLSEPIIGVSTTTALYDRDYTFITNKEKVRASLSFEKKMWKNFSDSTLWSGFANVSHVVLEFPYQHEYSELLDKRLLFSKMATIFHHFIAIGFTGQLIFLTPQSLPYNFAWPVWNVIIEITKSALLEILKHPKRKFQIALLDLGAITRDRKEAYRDDFHISTSKEHLRLIETIFDVLMSTLAGPNY